MWPFKPKKSEADLVSEWMPRAIDVAAQKWLEFESQPFAEGLDLEEKLFVFNEGLTRGLNQWKAFKRSPDPMFLLIAAKGIERSGTHLRIQIESALQIPLPEPHERTDEEEGQELTNRIIENVLRKWAYFAQTLQFTNDIPLLQQIEAFRGPFLESLRRDYPMFRETPDDFFDSMIALGIEQSGTHSLLALERALQLKS